MKFENADQPGVRQMVREGGKRILIRKPTKTNLLRQDTILIETRVRFTRCFAQESDSTDVVGGAAFGRLDLIHMT